MDTERMKAQLDKLRAEASRGPVPSSVVFALTDPLMDAIARDQQPEFHPCCGYPSDGEHNTSCALYETNR